METPAYMPYATSGAPLAPMPPRLHWGWVLLLSILTRSFFADIWLLVQANWIRKTTGRGDVLNLAIANACKLPVGVLIGLLAGLSLAASGSDAVHARQPLTLIAGLYGIVALALYFITTFRMRDALEQGPIGLVLGPVTTFFFAPYYFQYFLRDWVPMPYTMATPNVQYTYPNVPPQA